MSVKQRLSASVDADMIEAGRQAVVRGDAESLSAWVNAALHRQAEHDQRLQAMDAFIAEYEAEHGEITEEEMEAAERWARENAIVVNGTSQGAA
jgi:histidinol dehydrogenase